jgi:dTDP-4-dehydrorhamnose reductase
MKVAVIGANGQLGSDVVSAFSAAGDTVQSLTHVEIEISEQQSVRGALRGYRLDVIVNTAAMHHVEQCEQDPAKAYAVNAIGARNVARIAKELGSLLIHVSTDYVFDGRKLSPYVEEDAPQPLNVYGNTKLAGEHYVRSISARHQVIRTSGIYGKHPCRAKGGLNFVELMLKLARERGKVRVVDDEFVTPTFTAELAEQIVTLSRSDCTGLFHATAEGSCSWFEFAREVFSVTGTKVDLEAASPDEFPAKVPRPKHSVLENRALKDHELNCFRPWQEGLRQYLDRREGAIVSGSLPARRTPASTNR